MSCVVSTADVLQDEELFIVRVGVLKACVLERYFFTYLLNSLRKNEKKSTNNACNSMSELLCALFWFCWPTGAPCLPMS